MKNVHAIPRNSPVSFPPKLAKALAEELARQDAVGLIGGVF